MGNPDSGGMVLGTGEGCGAGGLLSGCQDFGIAAGAGSIGASTVSSALMSVTAVQLSIPDPLDPACMAGTAAISPDRESEFVTEEPDDVIVKVCEAIQRPADSLRQIRLMTCLLTRIP